MSESARTSVSVVYDSDTEGDGKAGPPWTKLDAVSRDFQRV